MVAAAVGYAEGASPAGSPLPGEERPIGAAKSPVGSEVKRPVVAVVLSGGGALGLAHIGVLECIEQLAIPVDIVVGTSMGAVVGGLYAAGYTPGAIAEIANRADWDELFSDAPPRSLASFHERVLGERYQLRLGFDSRGFWLGSGLIAGQNITTLFELLTLTEGATSDFDRLPRRYRSIAMDILTGEEVVLARGSLADAMRASMSLPAIFSPYPVGGRSLVDGGIVDTLPVEVARRMGADIVIAVRTRTPPVTSVDQLSSPVAVLAQVSHLVVQRSAAPHACEANLVIEPYLGGLKGYQFSRSHELIERGRAAAREARPALEAVAVEVRGAEGSGEDGLGIGSRARAERPPTPLVGQRIASLAVSGGSADDRRVVSAAFQPIVGGPVDGAALRAAVERAYDSGRFALVRFHFVQLAAGARELVVGIVPAPSVRNALAFAVDYAGSWSSVTSSSFELSTGIILQGMAGRGSQLIAEGSFFGSQSASMEYYQPVGGFLFFDPYLKVFRGYLDRAVGLSVTGLPTSCVGGGLWSGVPMGRAGAFEVGYSIAAVNTYRQQSWTAFRETVSSARLLLRADSRPTSVFPRRGVLVEVGYERASPLLGGTAEFQKLAAELQLNLPVSDALTLAMDLSGGTDFTTSWTEETALPLAGAFDLHDRQLFRGYTPGEVVGSHKAAAGLDARVRLLTLSQLFGSDLLLLANLSVGNCWVEPPQSWSGLALRFGGSVGLGLRIERSFGLRLLLSAIESGRFAVSLDLGPMAEGLFDER